MPRQLERYCAKLVSDALGGVEYKLGYRFDFLRGEPTCNQPGGARLPVDAYYPALKLALEFRESQHYGKRFDFRDSRITAIGKPRKVQRKMYDRKREEILPTNRIKLLIIYDFELTGNYEEDLHRVNERVKEFSSKMLVGWRIDDICKEQTNG